MAEPKALKTEMAADDYARVTAAIRYLTENPGAENDVPRFARSLGLSERQLTDLFRRWCGLTPKSFAQAVALDYAKRLLKTDLPLLDIANEIGLSSASRLYDLFVTYEGMPPGAYARDGEGLEMVWGAAQSPFGRILVFTTSYGLAGLCFADDDITAAFEDMRRRWPGAKLIRDDSAIAPMAQRIFNPALWRADQPVRIVLIGTDFEVRVWETLLSIPLGRAATYGAVAEDIGKPKAARAVGAAVGRNPISFVVPCHRVVGSSGQLTGYHWGLTRKRAILGWEAGIGAQG